MLEGHGDDLHLFEGKVRHNFSTNIVSGVDHSGLIACLSKQMGTIGSYPEPWPASLEAAIAKDLGVGAENVVVTNGATDALYRIAHILEEGKSCITRPSFREYQDAAQRFNHDITFVDTPFEVGQKADAVWLCNPNNPTGRIWEKKRLLELAGCKDMKGALVIIDQAYADYTTAEVVSAKEAVEAGNIVLLSSLTKRFSVPGLRIGYIVAGAELASRIRGYGIPWAVNSIAIAAGHYLLQHKSDYCIDAEGLNSEAQRISAAFRCEGIDVAPTDCNFILCKLPYGEASSLKEFLVVNHGILIRDASNFEGLDEKYFRVAAQRPDENDELIKGVKVWLNITRR